MKNGTHIKLAALVCTLCLHSQDAHAQWSDLLTSRMWNDTDVDGNLSPDCGEGGVNGTSTPGRPAGGFFEWRFLPGMNAPGQFASLPPSTGVGAKGDATQACPSVVPETSMLHGHGVSSFRSVSAGGLGIFGFVTASGYYQRDRLRIQADPSAAVMATRAANTWGGVHLNARACDGLSESACTAKGCYYDLYYGCTAFTSGPINNRRPYSIIDLVRNPRNYVDVEPGSHQYEGTFDVNQDGSLAPGVDGCENISPGGTTPYGFRYDPLWRVHTGFSHERTFCGAPAAIQSFDPDLDLRPAASDPSGGQLVATWSERYVEGVYSNGTGGYPVLGFDSAYPVPWTGFTCSSTSSVCPAGTACVTGVCAPEWFPYRRMGVQVAIMQARDLTNDPGSTSRFPMPAHEQNAGGGSSNAAATFISPANGLMVGSGDTMNAFSPRVTQLEVAANTFRAVVAFAETTFKQAGSGRYRPDEAATVNLYVRQHTAGTAWASLPTLGSPVTQVCNLQTVTTGRASGDKETFTGFYDIATMKVGATERPIIATTEVNGADCRLVVKRYDGTTWTTIGGDLRSSTAFKPAWVRITVVKNIPYVVWVEQPTNATTPPAVRVKRLRSETSTTWDEIGGGTWFAPTAGDVDEKEFTMSGMRVAGVAGTAIAVVPVNPGTTIDDGADVFVSFNQNEPSQYYVNNGNEGPWGVVVRSCRTGVDTPGTSPHTCLSGVNDSMGRRRADGASDLSVYRKSLGGVPVGHLGVSWGERELSVSGSTPANQLTGYKRDTRFFAMSQPGATDIIASGESYARGEPALLLGWSGPVQNHRHFDTSLYARKVSPMPMVDGRLLCGGSHCGALVSTALSGIDISQLYTWGGNAQGQGMSGDTVGTSIKSVTFGEPIAKFAMGGDNTAVITKSGKLYMSGANGSGQICDGTLVQRNSPTQVGLNDTWADVAVGTSFVIALNRNGVAYGCGLNDKGQLGNNTIANKTTFTEVKTATLSLPKITNVYAGAGFACAISSNAVTYCWGSNDYRQLGRGVQYTAAYYPYAAPLAVPLLAKSVVLGGSHAAMVTASNQIYAWGANNYGQLGLGDTTSPRNQPVPATLPGPTGPDQPEPKLAAGLWNTYAISPDLKLYATGLDSAGQLGIGTTAKNESSFQLVGDATSVSHGATSSTVYRGNYSDPGRDTNFARTCWGASQAGQCAYGGTATQMVPQPAADPARSGCAANVTSMDFFSANGTAKMWGCGGAVVFDKRNDQCAAGYTACSAQEWVSLRGGKAPTHHYWTKDDLKYSGAGSANCSVSLTTGTACGVGTPMRVCTGTGVDARFNNNCNWNSCGFGQTAPNDYFGGCAGNTTAGTLCCKL